MPPPRVSTLAHAPDCDLPGVTVESAPPPSQSPPSAVDTVLGVAELLHEIIMSLPNAGHIRLVVGVSRSWRRASLRALDQLFSINRLLAPYFSDVVAFRRLQCELDILISGSFALSMFRLHDENGNPTMGVSSDMDLFVEWALAEELELFLIEQGYHVRTRFENPIPDPDTVPPGISIPDDSFERVVRFERGEQHIDVVCTTSTPIYCIFRFHSTVVMNFVTWNRAYSMFPYDTLLKNRGLVIRVNNQRTRRAIEKYVSRGFEMIDWREGPPNVFDGSLRSRYRWVGDDRCWEFALDTTRIITEVDPYSGHAESMAVESDYPYALNGFMLEYDRAPGPTVRDEDSIWYPLQDCDLLIHPSLLYSYAAGQNFYEQAFRYLRRRANLYGESWRYRGIVYYVDQRLQHVKSEFIRCIADPDATPHPLYG